MTAPNTRSVSTIYLFIFVLNIQEDICEEKNKKKIEDPFARVSVLILSEYCVINISAFVYILLGLKLNCDFRLKRW